MLVIRPTNLTSINQCLSNEQSKEELPIPHLGRMYQSSSYRAGNSHHNALRRLQYQYPHLLRDAVGADIKISYYLRVLDYLHDFLIEEEDFRKVWMELGGYE